MELQRSDEEELRRQLEDRIPKVRHDAATELQRLEWTPANEAERMVFLCAREDWEALAACGKKAAEVFVLAAETSDNAVRLGMIAALLKTGDTDTAERINALRRAEDRAKLKQAMIVSAFLVVGFVLSLAGVFYVSQGMSHGEIRMVARNFSIFVLILISMGCASWLWKK